MSKKIIDLDIDGMSCAACSTRIEKVLSDMEDVEQVSISLASHTGKIILRDNSAADAEEKMLENISKLGFSAKSRQSSSDNRRLVVDIEGMHCASCTARVERVLSQKEGIDEVTVSLASHTAGISLSKNADRDALIAEALESIEKLGFKAKLASNGSDDASFLSDTASRWKEREAAQLADLASRKKDLYPAFIFTLPLLIFSMGEMMGLPLPKWLNPMHNPATFALVQMLLCIPVIWSGRRFYLHGIPALLKKTPTMDTLVALGTGAAFIYSLWNTLILVFMPDLHSSAAFSPVESSSYRSCLGYASRYWAQRSWG